MVVEFVLSDVTVDYLQYTFSINKIVRRSIYASQTISVGIIESITERRDVKASLVDFVLSSCTDDHWRNTNSIYYSTSVVLASQAGSSEVVVVSTGVSNWETISKVEILTITTCVWEPTLTIN